MTSNYFSQNTLNSRYSKKSSHSNVSVVKDIWIGKIVCKNYKILSIINQGSFGKIYKAIHQIKNDYYAVKIEHQGKEKKLGETLYIEAQILFNLKGEKGFPRLQFFVQDSQNRIMVETLLGKNMEELFIQCRKKFSLKTVLLFVDQALNRLEFLHKNNYIHRDIKPENFLIGLPPNQETIYLIDFGLSMKYIDNNGNHVKQQMGQAMVGTARFTPLCSHQGFTQNRASDLESLGYLLIFFLNGSLPWMNMEAKTRDEKFQMIGTKKLNISSESLWQNRDGIQYKQSSGLPQEFTSYFNYLANLSFEQEPSYVYIRKLFRKLFLKSNFENDEFEWIHHEDSKDNNTERIVLNKKLYTSGQFESQLGNPPIIEEMNSCDEKDNYNLQASGHFGQMGESKKSQSSKRKSKENNLLVSGNFGNMGESRKSISSKNKIDGWGKSISMHVSPSPVLTQSKSKVKQPIEQIQVSQFQENNKNFLEVMMDRKNQHNSILSKQTAIDDCENLRFEDSNEYTPYLSLYEQMMKLSLHPKKIIHRHNPPKV